MGSLVKLEMLQHNREWFLWTVLLAGLVVMGLAFYPTVSGSMAELSVFFDNPLMSTVLSAFGADADSLRSLTGFYRTYGSIYVTLLGCMYAALSGVKRIAREEQRGTAEYLMTRPRTRRQVYWTKAGVLLVHLALLNGFVFFASFVSLEVLGRSAPHTVHVTARTVERIGDALENDRENNGFVTARFVPRSRDIFERVLIEAAASQGAAVDPTELQSAGITPEAVAMLMDRLDALGPDALLDDVEANPNRYQGIFTGSGAGQEEIVAGVRERRREIEEMWRAFRDDPGSFHQFFRLAPETLLAAAAEAGTLDESIATLGLPRRWATRLYAPYSFREVSRTAVLSFLGMVTFGAVGFLFATVFRSMEAATGGSLAFVVLAYFIDVVTSAAGTAQFLRWLSPIAMISGVSVGSGAMSAGGAAIGTVSSFTGTVVPIVYFVIVTVIALMIGAYLYRRRDIFVP